MDRNGRETSADENKRKMLSLPVGSPKPGSRTPLGRGLYSYTQEDSGVYDKEFTKAIRKRFAIWFSDIRIARLKARILSKPRGTRRPGLKSRLWNDILEFTRKTHLRYDEPFDREIRERQERWFWKSSDFRKEELLAMSVGCKKPSQNETKIGDSLWGYTYWKHPQYDPEFDRKIRARQPGWWKQSAVILPEELGNVA